MEFVEFLFDLDIQQSNLLHLVHKLVLLVMVDNLVDKLTVVVQLILLVLVLVVVHLVCLNLQFVDLIILEFDLLILFVDCIVVQLMIELDQNLVVIIALVELLDSCRSLIDTLLLLLVLYLVQRHQLELLEIAKAGKPICDCLSNSDNVVSITSC
jgi:hypothetical protein